jgi:hypothetical protein
MVLTVQGHMDCNNADIDIQNSISFYVSGMDIDNKNNRKKRQAMLLPVRIQSPLGVL